MHAGGTDSTGDSIDTVFNQGDNGLSRTCGLCAPGQTLQEFQLWEGIGHALVNGVGYGGGVYGDGDEFGKTVISGVLPPITDPVGTQLLFTFPITWSLNISLFQGEAMGCCDLITIFSLQGSGVGIGSFEADIVHDINGNVVYQQDGEITYTSTPEAQHRSCWRWG